jgi:mono/diheme cytochrome c family protein
MRIPSAAVAAVITLAGLAVAAVAASAAGPAGPGAPLEARSDSIAHGRYLVTISGCHDCHTAGHLQSGGHAPASDWLTGQTVGFQGPWGTTYPANLRRTVQSMTETQWLVFARAEKRPPMPWFNLKEMSDRDLTDIYRFIRSLGPAGKPAPAAVPPGGKVNTPFIVFEPQNLGGHTVTQVMPPKTEPRG